MTVDYPWKAPPEDLTISTDEVHVWRVFLDQPNSLIEGLAKTLSEEEQNRAERFYFQKDRNHFLVARGVLRDILGRYLNQEPEQFIFNYNEYGKPVLANEVDGELAFNLSHSGGIALYGMTLGRDVGIDIERIRPEFVSDQIAERFFSPKEAKMLRSLAGDQQKEAFFNCWTRKEAFIKATGQGVSFGLDNFSVSLMPQEPVALLSVKGDAIEADHWSLNKLDVQTGFKAALAVEGHDFLLKRWQWQPFELDMVSGQETGLASGLY